MHSVVEDLTLLTTSGYPLVYMLTHEEDRARRLVAEAVKVLDRKLGVWSVTGGLKGDKRVGIRSACSTPSRRRPPVPRCCWTSTPIWKIPRWSGGCAIWCR